MARTHPLQGAGAFGAFVDRVRGRDRSLRRVSSRDSDVDRGQCWRLGEANPDTDDLISERVIEADA